MKFCGSLGLVASGSWDGTVATWDGRAGARAGARAATITAPERVYSMDYSDVGGAPLLAAFNSRSSLL